MKQLSLTIKIAVSIVVILCLGIGSGWISGSGITNWYNTLNKPFFQPPSWIFGPAWTILYTLMGISFALIWHDTSSPQANKNTAIRLFLFQMVLNLIWSPVFFAMEQPLMAFVIIVIMWIAIATTIQSFITIQPKAAYLLIPYLMWVTFASVLNASIVYLN